MATEELENNEQERSLEAFNFTELLQRLWGAKYWVMISIIICMSAAYLNYKMTAGEYGASADVMLVSSDDEGSTSAGAMQVLSNISGATSQGDVNFANELEVMRSPMLVESVVERLNMCTTYTTEGFGHQIDLYGHTPVLVNFLDMHPDSTASMCLVKTPTGNVIATDFVYGKRELPSKPLRITPGTVVQTPVGIISVSATADFDKFPKYVEVHKNSLTATAQEVADHIVTDKKSQDNTVAIINYRDVSQQRAVDVVNTLIDCYNVLWVQEQTRVATNTAKFIDERLAVLRSELSGIDSDISRVKSAHQMADFATATSSYYGQTMDYDTRAFEASTQLSVAQFLRDYINQHANDNALIPTNTGTNGAIETQIQEYNRLMAKRDQLLQNSTDANPVVAQLNSDLAANRALILASLNNAISSYRIQEQKAQGRQSDYSGKVSSVPEQEKQILSIERQQKVKENLYLYLLQKREENELAKMVKVNNTRVLRASHETGLQTGALTKALLIGFIIGLAIPALIIFLRMRFNTKVSDKTDLNSLTVPFVGEMPLSVKKHRMRALYNKIFHPNSRTVTDKELRLVVRNNSRSYMNEAFRMLRTNIDFLSHSGTSCKVIMLTSFNPGSGKTFISMNLAKSLALKGKRVVVVDMDLRRASASRFGGSPTYGVSSFLTGKVDNVMELIKVNNQNTGIDLLSVGAIPPNPVELVLSSRFEEMIDRLRTHYDYIVLDCPPYDIVADTALIARVVDITLFVVRAGLFNKALLPELEKIYRQNKLPHMAIVLNGVNTTSTYYHNRYGYSGKSNNYYVMNEKEKAE